MGWPGFPFESLVAHEQRVLAGPRRAQVRLHQDHEGPEVDADVERRDGRSLGVEVKRGVARAVNGRSRGTAAATTSPEPPASTTSPSSPSSTRRELRRQVDPPRAAAGPEVPTTTRTVPVS